MSNNKLQMEINDIKQNFFVPDHEKYTPVKDEEAEFMYQLIKDKNLKKTCEIGLGYGKSALYILCAALKNNEDNNYKHIVMDPFQSKYEYGAITNFKKVKADQSIEFQEEYSHFVLPTLVKSERKFDFILIDGGHKYDDQFVDFYYSDLLAENGAYILLHDTWMRSTALLISYIKSNRKDYKHIHVPLRNLCLFQKIAPDNRDWLHFKEFYSLNSFFRYRFIMWLNGDSKLKKLLLKLKDSITRK